MQATSPSEPQSPSPVADETTGRGQGIPRHLADLERRLSALENDAGPPEAVARRLTRRIADLESREHHHAQALAHLEARLATLLERLVPGEATPGDRLGVDAGADNQPSMPEFPRPRPRSLARRGLELLHYLRYVWRRLKGQDDGPFADHSLIETQGEDVHQLPRLGIVVTLSGDEDPATLSNLLAGQSELDLPFFIYTEPTGVLRSGSPEGNDDSDDREDPDDGTIVASGNLSKHLRTWAPTDYLVATTPTLLARWPSTLCETLRLALAAEELDFLEVLLPGADRILVQRTRHWREGNHLDPQTLSHDLPNGVGKVVNLSSTPARAELDRCFERQFGPYRYGKSGRTLIRHRVVAAPPTESPSAPTPSGRLESSLLLAEDLLAGREQLFSDLFLRLGARRLALFGPQDPLSRERWAQLHSLRRLDGETAAIYPLAEFLPSPSLAGAVAWLAQRWGCRAAVPLAFHGDARWMVGASRENGLTVRQPPRHEAGFELCGYDPGGGQRSAEAGIEAMRKQLGLAPRATVVLWYGDLLASRRPDVFLAMAQRHADTADTFFLMVGRGPQEGSIDDLARFLGLPNFRRLPSLPLTFAVALSDLTCLTSQEEPLPYGLLASLSEGRPVLLPSGTPLAAWIIQHGAGMDYLPGDAEDAAAALDRLLTSGQREAMAGQGQVLSRDSFSLADVDAAWRRVLAGETLS